VIKVNGTYEWHINGLQQKEGEIDASHIKG